MSSAMQWAVVAAIIGSACASAQAGAPIAAVDAALAAGRPHVPGEVIVQYKANAQESAKIAVLLKGGARSVERLRSKRERRDGKGDLTRLRLGASRPVDGALLETLRADPAVEYVEPNWIYHTDATAPNDPGLSLQWGMQAATTSPAHPYGSGALAAWGNAQRCSAGVHVGIVDTGVMLDHPDLKANAWVNMGEGLRANLRDNDLNGYVDDLHGWDFRSETAQVFAGMEDEHGTHVAGIVAAAANNRIGTMGVCPRARLISTKFMGAEGGNTADAVRAIQYLTQLKQAGHVRLAAINASWNGDGYSQALYDAVRAAGEQNILFVTSAGNTGRDLDQVPSYPANIKLPNVITVASIAPTGALAADSNYGTATVDIAAPGVNIVSTVPVSATEAGYAYLSGTSMAAPHVTGAAALYASLNPCATAAQVREALLRLAVRDPQLAGRVGEGRRLDISSIRPELNCTR